MSDANRVELERLTKERWFLDLSKDQQMECWQHKLQLVSKQSRQGLLFVWVFRYLNCGSSV